MLNWTLYLNKDPAKLLGVILLCNNFVNILASAIATILGIRLFGSSGVILSTVLLTILILLFAEQLPKTIATHKSENISMFASGIIYIISKVLTPIIIVISAITNFFINLVGIKSNKKKQSLLSNNELREMILDRTDESNTQQKEMLLSILDLEEKTLEEKAIVTNKIYAIDILDDWQNICKILENPKHTFIPVYEDELDNIKGILDVRKLPKFWQKESVTSDATKAKNSLLEILMEAKFLHESTNLITAIKVFNDKNGYHIPLAMVFR